MKIEQKILYVTPSGSGNVVIMLCKMLFYVTKILNYEDWFSYINIKHFFNEYTMFIYKL